MKRNGREMFVLNIEIDPTSMFGRIDRLRIFVLDSEDMMNELSDDIFYFDAELQLALKEQYADEYLRKTVPEWHKLVGSTPEDHEANPEAKKFIAQRVEQFVSEMETKLGL